MALFKDAPNDELSVTSDVGFTIEESSMVQDVAPSIATPSSSKRNTGSPSAHALKVPSALVHHRLLFQNY